MGKDIQKNALPTLFHFVRARGAYHSHVVQTNKKIVIGVAYL